MMAEIHDKHQRAVVRSCPMYCTISKTLGIDIDFEDYAFYASTRQSLGRSRFGPVSFIQSLGQGSSPSSLVWLGEGQSDRLWCQFLGCCWLLGCLSAPTWRIPGLPVRAASYSSGLSLDLT